MYNEAHLRHWRSWPALPPGRLHEAGLARAWWQSTPWTTRLIDLGWRRSSQTGDQPPWPCCRLTPSLAWISDRVDTMHANIICGKKLIAKNYYFLWHFTLWIPPFLNSKYIVTIRLQRINLCSRQWYSFGTLWWPRLDLYSPFLMKFHGHWFTHHSPSLIES